VLGGALSLATASQGGSVAWIVPTYKNGRSLWRWAEATVAPLKKSKRVMVNKTERTIEFSNGGFMGIFSADNEDSIRGEAFHLAILDEAARMSPTAWTDAIQPTLADYEGDAIIISTPKGMNWFYTEWARGNEDGKYQVSFRAPSAANPMPQIQKAARLAEERVPALTYQQEWLAEFIKDGAYFQGVEQAAVIDEPDAPAQHPGHNIFIGADWAISQDYTVLVAGCRECNRVVDWERFNKIDFTYQRARLVDMATRWKAKVLPERNSIGVPNIELLVDRVDIISGPDGGKGFNTTATTKPELIQALASALEHHNFKIPSGFASEFMTYQIEVTTAGHPKFGAPEGMHDDRVIGTALCWWGMTHEGWYFA
jgi:hypothetical protein